VYSHDASTLALLFLCTHSCRSHTAPWSLRYTHRFTTRITSSVAFLRVWTICTRCWSWRRSMKGEGEWIVIPIHHTHHTLYSPYTTLTIHYTHYTLHSPYTILTIHYTHHTLHSPYTTLTIHYTHHTLYSLYTILPILTILTIH
jgi:hypothetical protein